MLSSSSTTTALNAHGKAESSEKDKYLLDLRRDIAFKVVFGHKEFLLDLLNSLPIREGKITDLVYNPTESLPAYRLGKKVIFDLKCTAESGEIFIVEMQIAEQIFFKERALYYVARSIDQQLRYKDKEVDDAETAEEKQEKLRNYRIEPVIGIFLMCFSLEDKPVVMRDIRLCDCENDHQPFSDKMRMIFLELPSIKSLEECDTELKQWLYIINNSRKMEQIPFAKDKPLFDQLKEIAKHHALTPEQQELYDNELRNEIAYYSSIVLAEQRASAKGEARGIAKGRAEGIAEGRAEERAKALEEKKAIAQNLKKNGVPVEVIASSTGFTIEEINHL